MKSMGLVYYDLYKKRYSLSNKFSSDLQKIGVMWNMELNKPIGTPVKKKNG
jgi:hypothetical protein